MLRQMNLSIVFDGSDDFDMIRSRKSVGEIAGVFCSSTARALTRKARSSVLSGYESNRSRQKTLEKKVMFSWFEFEKKGHL